ncbi:MAG TPA: hypothetical protein VIT42_08335, partial [Microlunatus sp.]
WAWRAPTTGHPWQWCRIYHPTPYVRTGTDHRAFGPLGRLDHHTVQPAAPGDPHAADPYRIPTPWVCPDGRAIRYVGANLRTGFTEVYTGPGKTAEICPQMRVAIVRPSVPIPLLDIKSEGAAMLIDALPSLASGDCPRPRTQEWARAIYEYQPVSRRPVRGIYYQSAHAGGTALALMNTAGAVQPVHDRQGVEQDFTLHSIWRLVETAAVSVNITAYKIPVCGACN